MNQKKLINPIEFITIFSLVSLVGIFFFNVPGTLYSKFIWETDGLLAQAQIQSIIDSGPFGKTTHLGFPQGFSQWSTPEFSIIYAFFIWIIGNLFSFTNFGIYILVGIISLTLNGIYTFVLAKMISSKKIIIFSATTISLITPYAVTQLGHPHVMPFFLPLMILIHIVNLEKNILAKNKIIFWLFLTTLLSPLFWINTILVILLIINFPLFFISIYNKKVTQEFLLWLKAGTIIFLGFLPYLTLVFFYRNLNPNLDRGTWHSDLFAGKFTDFILGSPFLNDNITILTNLLPGESIEAKYLRLGLVLALFALLAIFYSIGYNNNSLLHFNLKAFSIAAITLFLIGGFGNLQAAFFALFESSSPMRSWARLSIVIALVGLVLFLYFLNTLKYNKQLMISVSMVVLAFLDLIHLEKPNFNSNYKNHEYYRVLEFIDQNFEPCPVLQLPVDTYLLPQGHLDGATRYYWNGKIPYIILPEFYWTASTYVDSRGWNFLKKIPTEIDEDYLSTLNKKGYCAILFDKDFSNYQIDRQANLNSEISGWPGLKIDESIEPIYSENRFMVYKVPA